MKSDHTPPETSHSRQLVLAILGPTAAGKSAFAIDLAERIGGEIVCMDSTTIYRGFDIGSSKPTAEQRQRIPHHLIDILDPDELFSVHTFCSLAIRTITELHQASKIPILVGGTYFYLRALQHGMFPQQDFPKEALDRIQQTMGPDLHSALREHDPRSAESIHPNDQYRLVRALATHQLRGKKASELTPEWMDPQQASWLWMKYALVCPRDELGRRIETRANAMLEQGWIAEVERLHAAHPTSRPLKAVGYKEVVEHLAQGTSRAELVKSIVERTRQLAKRQLTWLRSDPEVRFVGLGDVPQIELEVRNMQKAMGQPR